ncbi:hypothetical protein LCGC14_1580270, partial [marine sediment metagenome]
MDLTHISLFAGIGGIDLAAEWAGFKTVCFVEIDPYCQKVLNKHWPDTPTIGDIRDATKERIKEIIANNNSGRGNGNESSADINGLRQRERGLGQTPTNKPLPSITLITGGFPCQPVSVAGKRRGKEDDRWLWPEMLRVISEIRPTWVIAENVFGLTGMVEFDRNLEVDNKEYTEEEMAEAYLSVGEIRERTGRGSLDEILESLEAEGYEVQPIILPACAVNAPHRRDRVFIVAYAKYARSGTSRDGDFRDESQANKGQTRQSQHRVGGQSQDVADTAEFRCTLGERWGTGKCIPQSSKSSGSSWWAVEPELGRVAHGIPSRVDRLRCLGNAVVPQQIYPILKA